MVISNDKIGLWVFGKESDKESVLPSSATPDSEGLVEVHGIRLSIKQEGIFEPASTWKAMRPLPTPSSSQTSNQQLPASVETARTAQAANAKAVQTNANPSLSQEPSTNLILTKIESPLTPAVERTFLPLYIQEHFIAAVLASLNYRLCHDSGFISLNARTLILPETRSVQDGKDKISPAQTDIPDRDAMLMVTLDVHLTSLGNLIIKASPVPSLDFSCVVKSKHTVIRSSLEIEGANLYLAPIGSIARYFGSGTSEDNTSTTSLWQSSEERYLAENPHLKSTLHKWKQRCTLWLEGKGIMRDTFEGRGWIMVQIFLNPNQFGASAVSADGLYTPEEKLMTIPWPALLSFRRKLPTSSSSSGDMSQFAGSYDPLAFAERWFTAKADRELTIAKRKKEREAATAAVKAQAENEARLFATNHYSPVALRRASIAGAVYPTPPDGLPIGATPSFDGNVSTPGYPNAQPLQTDSEHLMVVKGEVDEVDSNLFDVPDTKRDQANTSLDFTESGNDLFGDMGGDDLFGENDITDADFSFFDEPDIVEPKEEKVLDPDVASVQPDVKAEISGEIVPSDVHHDPSDNVQQDVEMNDVHETPNTSAERDGILSSPVQGTRTGSNIVDQTSPTYPSSKLRPKSPSPPLTPELVFKRLSRVDKQVEGNNRIPQLGRKLSVYDGVDIDNPLSKFNEKYGAHGRYTSPFFKKTLPKLTAALPKTGYLNKRRKTASTPIDILNKAVKFHQQAVAFPTTSENLENPSDAESPGRSRSSSILSDQDDSSNTTDDGHLDFVPSAKRKRGPDESEEDDDMTSSFQELNVEGQQINSLDPLDLLDPSVLDPDPADWSFARFFSCPEPRNTTTALSDISYISAAQILSEQAISRTLMVPEITSNDSVEGTSKHCTDNNTTSLVQEAVAQATKSCFNGATQCNLAAFIDIQGQHPIGQLNRLPPRPMPNPQPLNRPDIMKLRATFALPAPHLQVRRADSKLTVLPSAIPFWENLGLGPSKGGKDIKAVCIYPDGEGMAENIDAFLEHTRSAYESGKLGSHDRFTHTDIPKGLVPIDFGEGSNLSVADHQAVLVRINEASTKLGGLLASGSAQDANIVVYYIYDPANAELLVSICSAFHDLFVVYKENLSSGKSLQSNELVLQLVPMGVVASHDSLVVPQPFVYSQLAMEVYDRCVDLKSGTAAPSIVLETPLPRNIDFKLVPNPSASLLQENSVMHIAYAQSIDDRWIVAAWTDTTGNHQATASYCLGRKNAPITTSFSDIAHEIWESTLDIISMRKVHWRIMIAKSGVMEPFEVDFWKGLASTESKAQISLSLITVDTTPSLTLLPPSISLPPSSLTVPYTSYTTPVSTPSASVFSPDHNPQTPHGSNQNSGPANAPTPTGDSTDIKLEPDATLIDVTDQTWGVALSHRLNNSRSLLDFHPALFSGYLIKRSGPATSDPLIVIEVNLVHSEMNSRLYEVLLREVLGHYRGLATLARARGVVAREGDGRPWHIAAVEKAVAVLHLLM